MGRWNGKEQALNTQRYGKIQIEVVAIRVRLTSL